MKTINTPPHKTPSESQTVPLREKVEETPYEAVASSCSVLVVGLFILTFLAQNYAIPSGSMENTLLIGDHLVVDRATLAPLAKWMPLLHYREPRRGDIVAVQWARFSHLSVCCANGMPSPTLGASLVSERQERGTDPRPITLWLAAFHSEAPAALHKWPTESAFPAKSGFFNSAQFSFCRLSDDGQV
jgi:signal peptidase S26 family